ncbi:MAG: hypothetical protein ACLTSG_15520 [Lachnospiraceae bacterium]
MGIADTELSYEDILADDPELRHEFCATCFKTFGIYEDAAEQMATEAETYADEQGSTIEAHSRTSAHGSPTSRASCCSSSSSS